VGRRAQVSLATIYAQFPSRDHLVIAAVERWMASHAYRPLPPGAADEPVEEMLVRVFRHIFLPWVATPAMLTAFLHASLLPGGRRLAEHGMQLARDAGGPVATSALPVEVTVILSHLTHGLLRRFGSGSIEVGEIVRIYEVAVRRLLARP
jgi:AcrR family transcriptional regulator